MGSDDVCGDIHEDDASSEQGGGNSEVDGVSDGMHDDDGGGDSEVDGVSGGMHDDDGGGDSEDEGIEEDGGEIDLVPAGGLAIEPGPACIDSTEETPSWNFCVDFVETRISRGYSCDLSGREEAIIAINRISCHLVLQSRCRIGRNKD